MSKSLFINASNNTIKVALVDDRTLLEYHNFPRNNVLSVGDVYLGKVGKIMPTLNAAFVSINAERDAYLPYLELGAHFNSLNKIMRMGVAGFKLEDRLLRFKKEQFLDKVGKITDVLKKGQTVVVQISKEPISNKGAKISTELSFAGRFLVLLPFSKTVNISKKIGNPETKNRLRDLVKEIKPENFGLIIRTVAEDAKNEDIKADLDDLLRKWDMFYENLKSAQPVKKVLSEDNRLRSLIRDMVNESYQQIVCNDAAIFADIKSYLNTVDPSKEGLVKNYTSKTDIFEFYGVDKAIKTSFGKTVSFANGPYLVIEHTEAMHVIDVNSGRAKKGEPTNTREESMLEINQAAAIEIARQLRLRDMGGIIIIDFIDLKAPKHRKDLLDTLTEAMKTDKAKHTILPMTKFGLIQITRERVRPEVVISTTENCITCNGTGKMENSILVEDKLHGDLKHLIQNQNHKGLEVKVHPYVFAFLTAGIINRWRRWQWEFKTKLKITSEAKLHLNQYTIEGKDGEALVLAE